MRQTLRWITIALSAGALAGSGGGNPGCDFSEEADLAGRWEIVFDSDMTVVVDDGLYDDDGMLIEEELGRLPITGGVASGVTIDCDAGFLMCPGAALPELVVTQEDGNLGYATIAFRALNNGGEVVETEDQAMIEDYVARSGVRAKVLTQVFAGDGDYDRYTSVIVDLRFTDEDDDGLAETVEGTVTTSSQGYLARNIELTAELTGTRL